MLSVWVNGVVCQVNEIKANYANKSQETLERVFFYDFKLGLVLGSFLF